MHRTSQQHFGREVFRRGGCVVLGALLIATPGPAVPPVDLEQATSPEHASAPANEPDGRPTTDGPAKKQDSADKPVSPLSFWEQMIAGKTPVIPLDAAPVQPTPLQPDAAGPAPAVDPSDAPLPVGGEDGDAANNQPSLFVPQNQSPALDLSPPALSPAVSATATPRASSTSEAADGEQPERHAPVQVQFLETTVNGGLEAATNSNDRFTGANIPVVDPEVPPIFSGLENITSQSTRPWLSKGRLFLRLAVGMVFDDNVDLRSHGRRSDFILTLSPSVTYVLGSPGGRFSLTANYTAVGLYFLEGTSKNSVDHSGNVAITYRFNRLTVGGTLSARSTDGGNRDAGDRVQQVVIYLGAFANCRLTEKISLNLNGDLTVSDFSRLLDSQEARVQLFVDFAVRPKVQLGAGFLFGTLAVNRGPTQTYEQVLGRIVLTPTAKLGFNGSVGVEVRQLGDGVSDEVAPVFSVGITYNPWQDVSFSLDTRYRTYPSAALHGEDYQAFTLGLGVRRANLFDRFGVSLTFGFEHDRYQQTIRDLLADRRDNFFYTQVGLEWKIKKYLGVSAFYEFSFNESSGSGSQRFNRNRAGIFFTFSF